MFFRLRFQRDLEEEMQDHLRETTEELIAQGLRVSIGISAGLAGAWALTRFLASMLFGVQPRDAATFVAVAVVLTIAAMIAGTLSARRVLRIDPASALRADWRRLRVR